MAKKVIGNVTKSPNGDSFYIKVNSDVKLPKDAYLNLENEKSQLEGAKFALTKGWINEEEFEKRTAQIKSYWNDPVQKRDGTTFVRKDSIKYQVTINEKS